MKRIIKRYENRKMYDTENRKYISLEETELHPADPMLRAQNRAWIEFGGGLNLDIHAVIVAKEADDFATKCDKVKNELARIEDLLDAGSYLNGEAFSLADAAYAPTLMRLQLIREHYGLDLMDGLPKLQTWAKNLMNRDSVPRSVVPDFAALFCASITKANGQLAKLNNVD